MSNENKKSKFDGLKKFGGKIVEAGANAAKTTAEKVKAKVDDINEQREEHKAYIEATYEFIIVGVGEVTKPTKIRAFRIIDSLELLFKSTDSNMKYIKSETILENTSDQSRVKITFVDDKNFIVHSYSQLDKEFEVQCIRAKFVIYEKKYTPISNVINQSISISNSTIDGGVTQVNDLTQKLNDFEGELNRSKSNPFTKKNKTEAIKLYGSFKDCVINQRKDDPIVKKFLDYISYAPGLIALAKNLFL
jgi:hypothetical protein